MPEKWKEQMYHPPYFEESDRLAKIEPLFTEIDKLYKEYAEKNGFPGYAYGIVLDGQLVHSGSGGFIDIENQIPTTEQSMFRIASMTKSFVAMAVLKLRDEGKLRLDDPIDSHIPEMRMRYLTDDAPAITIRDLLIHSAGFPTDDPWADRKMDESENDLIAFLNKKISFSNCPGTAFEYSNLGYTLLGYLISKVSGMPYQEFIDNTICKPLGIECYWEYTKVPESQLALGYSFKDEKRIQEPLLHDGVYGALGGLIISVEAFSRYIALHQAAWPPRNDEENGPIKRSLLREMHRPSIFPRFETGLKYSNGDEYSLMFSYGYGLRWIKDNLGRVFIGHSGGLPGFGSNWYFMPEYGIAIVSFANKTYADTSKINIEALNKLIVEAKLQPRKLPPSEMLKDSQSKLLLLLPHWEAVPDGLFADNFFLDRSLESWRKESETLFSKAGNIISIGELVPENLLRGHFIIKGEKANLQVNFGLTPENPSQIQLLQMKCLL